MRNQQRNASSLRIYLVAKEISAEVYNQVSKWRHFDKESLGLQIVRAADSIANNIAEGYARVSTAERLNFLMYSEGSLQEVRTQLSVAYDRKLISLETKDSIDLKLFKLSISLIEFCHALLERDKTYKGRYVDYIKRRRAWRLK